MPFPQVPTPSTEMDTEQTKQYLVGLVRYLNWLLANMDTLNINRLDAKVIISESITTDKLAANSVTADKMQVNELSAISANLGHITAGLIEAVTMIGGIITGTLFRTAETGARVETNNGLITIYQTDGSKRLTIDSTKSPPQIIFFDPADPVNAKASVFYIGSTLNLATAGDAILSGNTSTTIGTPVSPLYLNGSTVRINGSNVNSNFASNMTFDPGTRNLKLYAPDGTQLAIVNIP